MEDMEATWSPGRSDWNVKMAGLPHPTVGTWFRPDFQQISKPFRCANSTFSGLWIPLDDLHGLTTKHAMGKHELCEVCLGASLQIYFRTTRINEYILWDSLSANQYPCGWHKMTRTSMKNTPCSEPQARHQFLNSKNTSFVVTLLSGLQLPRLRPWSRVILICWISRCCSVSNWIWCVNFLCFELAHPWTHELLKRRPQPPPSIHSRIWATPHSLSW